MSRSAVSRTFTDGASVSDETRKKVIKAARELGYRVNVLARSLHKQKSDLVGVVAADLDNPFRAEQIDLLSQGLLERGFRPILLRGDPSVARCRSHRLSAPIQRCRGHRDLRYSAGRNLPGMS